MRQVSCNEDTTKHFGDGLWGNLRVQRVATVTATLEGPAWAGRGKVHCSMHLNCFLLMASGHTVDNRKTPVASAEAIRG